VVWSKNEHPDVSQPAIIALELSQDRPNHFVVLASRVGDRFQILDLGSEPLFVEAEWLFKRWNGCALYVARNRSDLNGIERHLAWAQVTGVLKFAPVAILALALCVIFRTRPHRKSSIPGASPAGSETLADTR
jgi:hypothetical protein